MKTPTTFLERVNRLMKNSMKDTTLNTSHGTYDQYVDCANCGERNNVKIQRGVEIKNVPCPNCGCRTLQKVL